MGAVKKVPPSPGRTPVDSLAHAMGHLRGKSVTTAGKPLAGCSVSIQETGDSVQSDDNGDFVMINLKPASYTLLAKRPGYYRCVLHGVRIREGDNPGLRMLMHPIVPIGAY
jgi:hypothetical protein